MSESKPITPADVVIWDGHGMADIFVDALRKAELEFTATLIARYHHANGLTEWTPVTRRQLGEFILRDHYSDYERGRRRVPRRERAT